MVSLETQYQRIWVVEFAMREQLGEPPSVEGLVALELSSGELRHVGQSELTDGPSWLRAQDDQVLILVYGGNVVMRAWLTLGWAPPRNLIDLRVEFRNHTNGDLNAESVTLENSLYWFGEGLYSAWAEDRGVTDTLSPDAACRDTLPQRCEARALGIGCLMQHLAPYLDIARALLRGRGMVATARMELTGIPIDQILWRRLCEQRDMITVQCQSELEQHFPFVTAAGFDTAVFHDWTRTHNMAWPRTPEGRFDLSDEALKRMVRIYPVLARFRAYRQVVSSSPLNTLRVGSDGRNRVDLRPFSSRTGRNQPRTREFILGREVYLRDLIKPTEGQGLAYIDYAQQEFGIAAALSGDQAMQAAYRSGDPYLAFAIQAGAAPADATRESHGAVRERYKACALGVLYGMGAEALAQQIDQPLAQAQQLLNVHRELYSGFRAWSDEGVEHAWLQGRLSTVFGWGVKVDNTTSVPFLRNYPMQANGAEMLRIACCLATEVGLQVCAPLHDALLIEAPLEGLDAAVLTVQRCMAQASDLVLQGFTLDTDVTYVRYPARYHDPRGDRVWELLDDMFVREHSLGVGQPVHRCTATCAGVLPRPILFSVLSKGE